MRWGEGGGVEEVRVPALLCYLFLERESNLFYCYSRVAAPIGDLSLIHLFLIKEYVLEAVDLLTLTLQRLRTN